MANRILQPLGALYATVMSVRNRLYDRGVWVAEPLPVPVVSVGNITLGGTGKTPIICELIRWANDNGVKAAVISRGYKGTFKGVARVKAGSNALEFGDEPTMMANRFPNTPIFVGVDRVAVGHALLKEAPDVQIIFADDAFQHRRLARAVDIVVIDCTEPIDNYSVVPAGRGREYPLALKRAHCIILNKVNLVSPEQKQAVIEFVDEILDGKDTPVIESEYYVHRLMSIGGDKFETPQEYEPITLLSGIGNPKAFEALLKKNFDVKKHFVFRDHHKYTLNEVQKVEAEARGLKVKRIVVTEKDAVKLKPLLHENTYFWQADLQPKLSLRVKWLYEKILASIH